jgi:hypothetical protein
MTGNQHHPPVVRIAATRDTPGIFTAETPFMA